MGSPVVLQAGAPPKSIHVVGTPANAALAPGKLSVAIKPPATIPPTTQPPFTAVLGGDGKTVSLQAPATSAPATGWSVSLLWSHQNPAQAPHQVHVPVIVEALAATGIDWTS